MLFGLGCFVAGWLCCIIIAAHRNRVNGTPTQVHTKSGRRIR